MSCARGGVIQRVVGKVTFEFRTAFLVDTKVRWSCPPGVKVLDVLRRKQLRTCVALTQLYLTAQF